MLTVHRRPKNVMTFGKLRNGDYFVLRNDSVRNIQNALYRKVPQLRQQGMSLNTIDITLPSGVLDFNIGMLHFSDETEIIQVEVTYANITVCEV